MSKALERRAKFREELILAAERSMSAGGLAGLKTRELAREIGVANGVPLVDFQEVTAGVRRWEDWCSAWSAWAHCCSS